MAFKEIFDFIKQETRKDILTNGAKDTPPTFDLQIIDRQFELTPETRNHSFIGTEPVGKVNKTAVDIALTQTEYDALKEDVKINKGLRDQMRRVVLGDDESNIKAIIRREVELILREHGLIK